MYKYKTKTPRKLSLRHQLPGYCCDQCKEYYDSLKLSPEELEKRLKLVSRHRTDPGPKTPEFFWELDFPDDEECIKRGYIEQEPKPYKFKSTNKYQ